jgi:hypothetical protein
MYLIETYIHSHEEESTVTIDGFGGHNGSGAAPPLHHLHRHR